MLLVLNSFLCAMNENELKLNAFYCYLFRWLKKHGLVARKLTILDALAPTVIPHSTKYVPILDKHVLSKVFDQVKTPFFKV